MIGKLSYEWKESYSHRDGGGAIQVEGTGAMAGSGGRVVLFGLVDSEGVQGGFGGIGRV